MTTKERQRELLLGKITTLDSLSGVDNTGPKVKHYGVKGMKWGIRKDRRGRKKSTRQVEAEERRSKTTSNKLSNRPGNRRPTDQELKKVIDRIKLEREYNSLTAREKQQPSRWAKLPMDMTFDIVKGAGTEVGKMVLTRALKKQLKL